MFIFSYAVLIVAIVVILAALYYSQMQFAENKRLAEQYKNGTTPATANADDAQTPRQTG